MGKKLPIDIDSLDVLKELSGNFTEPLELVREAISNSYDANANNIKISIGRQPWEGNERWVIRIWDDGAGMILEEKPPNTFAGSLKRFFGLGGSMRGEVADHYTIGSKGLGIKVAFHSESLKVRTWAGRGFPVYEAVSYRPWASIFRKELPEYQVQTLEAGTMYDHPFSEVEVVGFYDDDGSHFGVDEVEDYIKWFTKWGSFENRIRQCVGRKGELLDLHLGKLRPAPTGYVELSAPGTTSLRRIPFGHPFPDVGNNKIVQNEKLENVLAKIEGLEYDDMVARLEEAKKRHWRFIAKVGTLEEIPDVNWEAVISIEGDTAKRNYNTCLRERQRSARFTYKAQDRYGLWFCKDFFCVHRANEVAMEVLNKEGQLTRFKILLNCQNFKLNADRKDAGSTDSRIMRGLEKVAADLVKEMINDDSWIWTQLIEEEAEVRTSQHQDKLELEHRSAEGLKKPLIVVGEETIGRQPSTEAETVLLLERLKRRFAEQFSFFEPLDWRTDKGIDCVMKSYEPGQQCKFVEFKKDLATGKFNHTFAWLHYVVCWQVKSPDGGIMKDPANKQRKLKRHKEEEYELPETAPWTLEGEQRIIQVYSLKDILLEKLKARITNPP